MAQVLRNKNLATRFQILVEIAANQPFIQQKHIARRIGVTSQAVSEYMSELENDGWINSDGRSRYRVTREGVNWVLKALRELQQYCASAERTLTGITTWAAVADTDLESGQEVSLVMKEGLLYATAPSGDGARGITTGSASPGEDVGVTGIDGIVDLAPCVVTIVSLPDIQSGGSKNVRLDRLRSELNGINLIGAIGVEAVVALRRLDIKPDYIYGVARAAVEAVRSGLSFAIVCTAGESPALLQRFAEENIESRLVDIKNGKNNRKSTR